MLQGSLAPVRTRDFKISHLERGRRHDPFGVPDWEDYESCALTRLGHCGTSDWSSIYFTGAKALTLNLIVLQLCTNQELFNIL